MSPSIERAREYIAKWKGKDVVVTIAADNFSDEVLTVKGTVLAVAVRKKGSADFRGQQFDLVVDAGGEVAQVFALTRIRSIEER